MLSISDGEALQRALSSPIDDRLKRLLTLRRDQLGGDITDQAHFVVVEPKDSAADLERTIGFSVFENPVDGSRFGEPDWTPGWEWIEDHGYAYELCFIMDDSGFGHVVIIPKEQGVDSDLLNLCQQYASATARSTPLRSKVSDPLDLTRCPPGDPLIGNTEQNQQS
jgi:hypothetical protein